MIAHTQTNQKFRRPLAKTSVSAMVLCALGVVGSAVAQEDAGSAETTLEEVIVTGQRASIESAQEIKRDAEMVMDSITAVDIGALPDRSVAEALQRVPGVQLQRTNEARDPARLAAEGGDVFVRGLNWVRTELNGRDIFSASNGRSLGFEDVSADLMAGVDVYKAPTADMIEGGIGGTVNLRTRKPFDSDDMVAAASADYNYAELYEEGFPSFNGLFSNRWDTAIGEVGVLVSASVAEIGNRTDSIQTGRYVGYDVNGEASSASGLPAQNYLPNGLGFRRIDWEQERDSYSAAVQWAPSDKLEMTLQAIRTATYAEDLERAVGINADWGNDIMPWNGDFTYDDEGFLTGGTLYNAGISNNTRFGSRDAETSDYSFSVEYAPSENWTIQGDLQYVDSTTEVLSNALFTQLAGEERGPSSNSNVQADFSFGSDPWIDVSADERQAQQGAYWWGAAMDHIEDNEADALAGSVDVDYHFTDSGFMRSVSFGARRSDREAITRQSGWNWSLLNNQFWGGAPDADNIVYLDQDTQDGTELYTFDNFYGGDIAAPTVGWFPTYDLTRDPNYAYEQLADVQRAGWGWVPLDPETAYDLNPQADNVSAGINNQQELTTAGYLMARFGDDAGEILGIPFDGNIGVRVVETELTARGRSAAGGGGDACATAPSDDCAGAQAFADAYNAAYGEYADYEHNYTNVLPSLNLRFSLSEELQMRFGLSRAMVRPGFHQTQPYTTLGFDFMDNAFNPNSPYEGTGTGGNYQLEPTVSDQIDLSLEYYFGNANSVTLALFHKDIKDYIATTNQVESITSGGQTYDFEVTRQVNASEGKLKGAELAYQQFFDMLPSPFDGLGVQANYTFIDNEGGMNQAVNIFETPQVEGSTDESLPIEGISDNSYNLTLMYEKYDVSARLAYNWRERYLLTTSAANINRPVWFDDYGQLDGSVFYTINDNVKVGLQVTNLTAESTKLEVGDTQIAGDYGWTQGDRRFAFVVRTQF